METKRIVFLDYLRAIACFMVILVHVCEAFYFNLDGISFSSNADRWWISFIDSSLRPCVPLFIMASAYLLVPLKDSTPVFFKRLRYIYIPAVHPYLLSSCRTALGMSWKSGVAAEVIGIPQASIGEQLYYSKLYLDTAGLFAWTFAIIVISAVFERFFLSLLMRVRH